jgi:lysozyme family protein
MVRQGASQEDLKQEVFAYYKTITQDAADIIAPATTSKGIELFMRDCAVNHGDDGAQNVLRRALNVPKGTNLTQAAKEYVDKHGTTKLLQALSEARANYYTAILINKPEKQIFKKGWFNRNNNVTRAAFSLLNSH